VASAMITRPARRRRCRRNRRRLARTHAFVAHRVRSRQTSAASAWGHARPVPSGGIPSPSGNAGDLDARVPTARAETRLRAPGARP